MSPQDAAPVQDLSGLRDLVTAAGDRYTAWAGLVDPARLADPAVVIDEAEELRRQLRAAATEAHDLLARARAGSPSSPVPRASLAVAAASLDAAAVALRPVSTGLRDEEDLTRTAQASSRAAGRLLRTAAHALDQTDAAPGPGQRPGSAAARVPESQAPGGGTHDEPENPREERLTMTRDHRRQDQERDVRHRAARVTEARHLARLHVAQARQDRDDIVTDAAAEDHRPEPAPGVVP